MAVQKRMGLQVRVGAVVLASVLVLTTVGCQKKVNPEVAETTTAAAQEVQTTAAANLGADATAAADAPVEPRYRQMSVDFLKSFLNKRFDYVMGDFLLTPEMTEALTEEMLNQIHDKLTADYGAVVERKNELFTSKDGYLVWTFGVMHEKKALAYNVVIDNEGTIAGFNYSEIENLDVLKKAQDQVVVPGGGEKTADGAGAAGGTTGAKEEVVSKFETKDLSFGLSTWQLSGTVTYPEGDGPFPAVVLVAGSGQQDRDGTVGGSKPLKDIAEGLAANGIASLRYDKRTLTHALQFKNEAIAAKITVFDEVVNDAKMAVSALGSQAKIDKTRIFVVGHSLGGNQTPRIAAGNDKVAGVVLLSANVTPLDELMKNQVLYIANLDGKVDDNEKQTVDKMTKAVDLMNSKAFNEKTPAADTLGVGYMYWKDIVNYNPTELAKTLDQPILIMQGERDYQVPMTEFDQWKKALGKQATYKTYAKLNHLWMAGEGKPSPQDYQVPGHVDESAIKDMADWILKQK